MQHYKATRHLTTDVVRHAIIPLSRSGDMGRAYADGVSSPPAAFWVTHAWSNVFLHLQSAIVAHALGRKEYSGIAELLASRDVSDLKHELNITGKTLLTYWICCFCVNQHSCICSSFGKEPQVGTLEHAQWDAQCRDSVSGHYCPLCHCNTPKLCNDHPACEVNKFDAVMAVRRSSFEGFSLLVASDTAYNIFNRAWCVAEMVEAAVLELSVRVCFPSNEELGIKSLDQDVYTKLAQTSVKNCQASRAEDKEFILSSIPDIALFDTYLQTIIFGEHGIMAQKFSGFGLLEAAICVARRVVSTKVITSPIEEPEP